MLRTFDKCRTIGYLQYGKSVNFSGMLSNRPFELHIKMGATTDCSKIRKAQETALLSANGGLRVVKLTFITFGGTDNDESCALIIDIDRLFV